ncbi:LLM class flavin-dependent oxidoreductase [Microbacterium sp. YY-01]|uniref:LLM class flavin-dependent oxidoreductase n=1 Tax=Microbacterium sp. YY-01 TaxID=3421634 RepID=UPI003D180396
MTTVSAVFSPYHYAPEEFRGAVIAAERAELPVLWLWEDCFRESAYASAAAALAWTENLRVGVGISPFPLRNTALTAMEIATIERMFPGRLIPGFGHGVLDWMSQVGARVASPLTLMKESIPAIRALLQGEKCTVEGRYVTLREVALDWPPTSTPPLYAAGEGPKTLQLAGALADGVILAGGYSPQEFGEQIAHVQHGAADAGKTQTPRVTMYLTASFGDGAGARVSTDLGDRGVDNARAAWGDPADVADVVRQLQQVGANEVALVPTSAEPDLAEFFAATSEVGRIIAEKNEENQANDGP